MDKRKRKILIISFLVIFALPIFLCAAFIAYRTIDTAYSYYYKIKPLSDAADRYMTYLSSNNSYYYEEYFSFELKNKIGGLENLEAYLHLPGDISSADIYYIEYPSVYLLLTFTDGTKSIQELQFIYADGKWKINEIITRPYLE